MATDISALEAYAGQLSEAALKSEAAAQLQHEYMHGGKTVDVTTESGPLPTLAKQAVQSQEKVTAVLMDVAAQLAGAATYPTIALGLSKTVNGAYFSVPSAVSSEYVVLYENVSGSAVARKIYPSDEAVKALQQTLDERQLPGILFSVTDNDGFSLFDVDNQLGFGTAEFGLGTDGLKSTVFDVRPHAGEGVLLVDGDGFVIADLTNLAAAEQSQGSAGSSSIAERNAVNLAVSYAVRGEFNSEVQRPTAKYNHVFMYGQSLSTSNECWPVLSHVPFGGNLMLGDSSRPSGRYAGAFSPLNTAALKPLKAVVQSTDGARILTDAEVTALEPGAGNEGEGAEVGMMNFARKQFLQYHGLASDPSRVFVTSSCGVSGRTVEQLSKGASPELYLRLVQAAQGVKNIATAEGATYCIPAIMWLQGEWNYRPDYGGDTTKEGYKAKLLAQSQIWKAELAQGIAGQEAPPAIITYQTGAAFTRDTHDVAIGMAQFELSEEQSNWYMAAPYYPYTDKGGHLDSNGSRWLGMQLGKVFHRVVTLGQDWKPLSPRNITISDMEILIDFHVPCPPLVFDKPYVNLSATDYIDKGFYVKDSVGAISIRSVEIVAETIVRIELARAPSSGVLVQYATLAGSSGNGCLRDSDPTVSMYKYEYAAGTGQYAAANIPALVDKPYPLHNWCIAFSLEPKVI